MKMRDMSDEEMECLSSYSEDRNLTGPRRSVHLWEFLLELLMDETNSTMIEWTDEMNGEFKLKNSEDVAKKWGQRKHKEGMNYDKLSRALRYYYSKDIIKKVSGRRFVYKFVASPEMQAAVNAIKTHMARGGIKRIPVGPFPYYQQSMHDDLKRQSTQNDNKPFIYHSSSRPNSVSPRLEYGHSRLPQSNSPPHRSRSPHRSDSEDNHHPQGSIVLEHTFRDERKGSPHVVYPTESTYYRGGVEVKRDRDVYSDRKRHYIEYESDRDDKTKRYRYPDHHPGRHSRPYRRNSTNDYHMPRYKSTSPTPDSRLSLYEENARKYAEERLKVLDRFHFGRDNSYFRRQGSPGISSEHQERNGHMQHNHKNEHHSHSPSPPHRGYQVNNKSPLPPSQPKRPQSDHDDRRSPIERPGSTPAIVLSTNYLPKSVKETSPRSQYTTSVNEEEPRCYMYRRYSPMIDAGTQTEPNHSSRDSSYSGEHSRGGVMQNESESQRQNWKSGSPSNIITDKTNCGSEERVFIKKENVDGIPVSRYGETYERKNWKIPSPINTHYEQQREPYDYQNSNKEHDHDNHHVVKSEELPSPRGSPNIATTPSNCKCGCMETIESPSGIGTVVVYPKEIV